MMDKDRLRKRADTFYIDICKRLDDWDNGKTNMHDTLVYVLEIKRAVYNFIADNDISASSNLGNYCYKIIMSSNEVIRKMLEIENEDIKDTYKIKFIDPNLVDPDYFTWTKEG